MLLQGLFFLDPDEVTDPILLEHAVPGIRRLRQIAAQLGLTVAQLAIAFMRDCGGVTSLVLGSETPAQVQDNIRLSGSAVTLTREQMAEIRQNFLDTDPTILNPGAWPKA